MWEVSVCMCETQSWGRLLSSYQRSWSDFQRLFSFLLFLHLHFDGVTAYLRSRSQVWRFHATARQQLKQQHERATGESSAEVLSVLAWNKCVFVTRGFMKLCDIERSHILKEILSFGFWVQAVELYHEYNSRPSQHESSAAKDSLCLMKAGMAIRETKAKLQKGEGGRGGLSVQTKWFGVQM